MKRNQLKKHTCKTKKIYQRLIGKRFSRRIRHRIKLSKDRATPNPYLKVLTMPRVIGIDNLNQCRNQTLNVIHEIRVLLRNKRRTLVLDFTKTESPDAMGMILLLATVDYVLKETGRPCVRAKNIKSDRVKQVLKQIGLAEKLGINHHVDVNRSDVSIWKYVSGSEVDMTTAGEHFEQLCIDHGVPEKHIAALFNAFSEAVDNAHGHAYDQNIISKVHDQEFPKDKRWWMFFGIIDAQIIVVVCDLGLGIPRTVLRDGFVEEIRGFVGKITGSSRDDGKLIKATIDRSRSRTGEDFRGKGMFRLKRAILDEHGGMLQIHSNAGYYRFKGSEIVRNFKVPVLGTVIGWSIPHHIHKDPA